MLQVLGTAALTFVRTPQGRGSYPVTSMVLWSFPGSAQSLTSDPDQRKP